MVEGEAINVYLADICLHLVSSGQAPGASCTKTCVDFILKLGVRQNPETVERMDLSTFLLYISINVELTAHAEVPNSSLSTPSFKYAISFK